MDVKELKEKLFYSPEHGAKRISDEELKKADAFCEGYKKFLDAAKTERESVDASIEIAEKAGFKPYEKGKK